MQTAAQNDCLPTDTLLACNGYVILQWGSGAGAKPPNIRALITGDIAKVNAHGRVGVKVTCAAATSRTGQK